MMRVSTTLARRSLTLQALLCGALLAPISAQDSTVVLRGATVLSSAADPIPDGTVIMAGGRIQAVGGSDLGVPVGAVVVDAKGMFVTPGLIDAGAQMGLSDTDANEQGDEVTPHMRVLDALDRDDPRFAKARSRGVTTVHVTPGNRNVIGGLGAVVKTWGTSIADMLVKDGVGLRMTMGSEPSSGNRAIRGGMPNSMYSRRPTTRMGVIWAVRKAFYDAKDYQQRTIDPDNSTPPDAGMEVLVEALTGKVLVHTTARAEQDIRTALRLAEEFGYRPVLDEPVEAWRVADEIAEAGVSVLFGAPSAAQVAGSGGRDGAEVRWNTLNMLAERGVPFAIHTGTNNAALSLIDEAMFAVRNGLSQSAALDAITIVPAVILGVSDRVGSLEVGKDADVVLWTGHPLDPSSAVKSVYVGGIEAR